MYPQSIGGTAVLLHYLCLNLKRLGVPLEAFDFSSIRHPRETFLRSSNAIKYMATSDAVVFNSPPVGPLVFFLLLAKMLGKRTVFMFQGGIFVEVKGLLNRIFQIILLWELRAKIVEYVIVPSEWGLNFARNFHIRSEVTRIPIGIDFEDIDSHAAAKLATRNNILFVGRLAKIKGISTLLDACFLLKYEKCDYTLYLAGARGDLNQDEMNRIRETPNIHFLGQISHEKKISLMKGVDIVVVPSLWGENFPIIVLESMACARPVISTSVGGIPEIIDKNGLNGILVSQSNPTMLANAVKDLLGNPQKRAKISKNAYEAVKDRYDWKTVAREYQKFLLSLETKN